MLAGDLDKPTAVAGGGGTISLSNVRSSASTEAAAVVRVAGLGSSISSVTRISSMIAAAIALRARGSSSLARALSGLKWETARVGAVETGDGCSSVRAGLEASFALGMAAALAPACCSRPGKLVLPLLEDGACPRRALGEASASASGAGLSSCGKCGAAPLSET